MIPFALLGTYEYGTRNNVEVIATSEDYEELVRIWDIIRTINRRLEGKDREISNSRIRRLIDDELSFVDIIDEITGFVHEINILGIYRMDGCITVNCATCDKLLFAGPERESRRLVIYCTDCSWLTKKLEE